MIWIAGGLFTLSVCGWVLFVPPSARNPMRAVPSFAQVIYSSASPDREALKRLPFTRHGPDLDLIVPGSLQHAPLVLALAPLNGRDHRDTWIVVSSAGSRSVWLRWRMNLFPPSGVRRLASYGAWPVWQIDDPSFPSWMRVRFSVTEGLWIASISGDSHDIYRLLDTLDGRRLSKAVRSSAASSME